MFAGQIICGASISFTVIVNDEFETFPEASVAVAFTVVIPTGNAFPEFEEVETVAVQLSVAVTLKFTTALHEFASVFTVILEGTLRTGSSLSFTVTLNEHVLIFPEASVAVTFTIVVPIANTDPEAAEVVTVAEQLSVAVALKVTTAPHEPGSEFTVMSAGQLITGASLSVTVIVNELLVVFPDASVAIPVTVVVPIGKVVPEFAEVVSVALQLSVAVTLKFT